MADTTETARHRLFKPYVWATVAAGGLISAYCCYHLDISRLDLRFAILVGITLLLSSRITVPIPRFSSHVSVSDTFIFLTLLLFGGEAAILLAATEALLSSLRFSKKPTTVFFNWGCAACSVFITTQALRAWFGDISFINNWSLSASLVAATCAMALVQYASNSGLVAIGAALRTDQPVWHTWRSHYLWTSVTYFAGASAAVVIAKWVNQIGFYPVILILPIIAILFFTYRTYLKNIEASAANAEQAELHVKELSRYIAEQERIREQFSQMEKLSALGELASGVAHDFNNTLAGILGRAQLLRRTNDPEKIKRGLDIIVKAAEDGAQTVKRIQDFARQRRDHDFVPVSVDKILLDVSEITRPRWKDRSEASSVHISLALQIRSKSSVMGDESELRDVLVNMVFNAIDAMPNGGQLTLAVEDVNDSVVISVADTGTGMPPEVRSRIFDPFFTTKGKTGLGLGLAVSYGIIRRHEGTVEVDSEVGRGSTFRIILPITNVSANSVSAESLHQEPAFAEASSVSAQSLRDEHQLSVLVVDDEEPVRELLRDILEGEGCRVYLAPGGREALALFEARQFDGVFTDIGMPGMSGWDLARAIRERNQTIPIAVVTGWGEAVGSDEQKEAGVNWVITKPFTAARVIELSQEIRRLRKVTSKRSALSIVAA